jgi:hypothetical protein
MARDLPGTCNYDGLVLWLLLLIARIQFIKFDSLGTPCAVSLRQGDRATPFLAPQPNKRKQYRRHHTDGALEVAAKINLSPMTEL